MSRKKSDITDDLEELFKKTVEINSRYLKEGTELMTRLGQSQEPGAGLNLFQPETVAGAITAFARLNLEYYQNVLDLGLSISRQVMSGAADPGFEAESTHQEKRKPAFELSGTVSSEGTASLDFLLDNTLQREVTCRFENTDFVRETDPDTVYEFDTVYSPRAFKLAPGESGKVTIEITADPDAVPGFYTSRVKVLGFEPLFFLIRLNIPDNQTKKPGHGKTKRK